MDLSDDSGVFAGRVLEPGGDHADTFLEGVRKRSFHLPEMTRRLLETLFAFVDEFESGREKKCKLF